MTPSPTSAPARAPNAPALLGIETMLVALACALVFLVASAPALYAALLAQTWSIVDGEVIYTHASTTARPYALYRYEVDGVAYNSDRIRFAPPGQPLPSQWLPRSIAPALGEHVEVHFNPSSPADAVLSIDVHPEVWVLLFIGLSALGVGTGCWRDEFREAARVDQRLPRWAPIATSLGFGVAATILAIGIGHDMIDLDDAFAEFFAPTLLVVLAIAGTLFATARPRSRYLARIAIGLSGGLAAVGTAALGIGWGAPMLIPSLLMLLSVLPLDQR